MIGIALLGMILLLCACNLAAQAPATPTIDEPTSPPVETYTNATFGYSVEYPIGLTLDSNEDGSYVWIDRQISITVFNMNPEDVRGDGPVFESAEDTIVNSYPGRRLDGFVGSVGGNTPQRFESVSIPHNNLYYTFTVFELKNDAPLDETRQPQAVSPEALALFEQVLASLRFTD